MERRKSSRSILHGWISPAASLRYRLRVEHRRWRRQTCHLIERIRAGKHAFWSTLTEIVSLAWPVALAMLGETAMGLVDTKLVGGLGADALSGVGMGVTLMYLGYAVLFGLMRGVKVKTAYLVGQGFAARASAYARAGMLLGVAAGVVFFVLGRDVTPMLRLLGVEGAIVPHARDFLAARTWGALSICVFAALNQHRQGLGDTRTSMVVQLFGNVVNGVLAYGLIYGRFGLPALGVAGAGYGTAIAETAQVLVMIAVFLREERKSPRAERAHVKLGRAIREVSQIGLPMGLHFGLEMLAFTAFTALLAGLGSAELAAHHLALSTIRASFLPGVAVAEATSILVARSLGARKPEEADRITRAALVIGVGFMTLCGVAFALFGSAIAGGFSDDAEVIAIARRLLLVAAVFQTLDAANMVLRGALRGAKDVRWVAFVATIIVWSSIPTSALVFGRLLGLGAMGGWFGFIFETTLGALLLWRRWKSGAWRGQWAKGAAPAGATPIPA